jgi:hypothetical protein
MVWFSARTGDLAGAITPAASRAVSAEVLAYTGPVGYGARFGCRGRSRPVGEDDTAL